MTGLLRSLGRIWAVFMKETVQIRRDRLTFAVMFGIPIMQLILFGYAINMNPKHLPAALLVEEQTPIVRTMVQALRTSDYYDFVMQTDDPRETGDLLARGEVAFVVSVPAGFTRKLVRGENPQILIEADATDPAAASGAVAFAPDDPDRCAPARPERPAGRSCGRTTAFRTRRPPDVQP